MKLVWAVIRHLTSKSQYLWGLIWDLLVAPLLGLSLLVRCLVKGQVDEYLPRRPDLFPLIVVHGSGSSDHQALPVWFYLKDRANVFTVQLNAVPFPDETEDLPVYVDRLEAKLDAVLRQTEFDQVTLLGVSMGGLVAAALAVRRPNHVRRVITLGTPWLGTPAAEAVDMGTARHLSFKPGSPFLTELHEKWNTLRLPIISMGSRYDALVPYDYAHPPRAWNRVRIEHTVGHLSGVLFPGVWSQLRERVLY